MLNNFDNLNKTYNSKNIGNMKRFVVNYILIRKYFFDEQYINKKNDRMNNINIYK